MAAGIGVRRAQRLALRFPDTYADPAQKGGLQMHSYKNPATLTKVTVVALSIYMAVEAVLALISIYVYRSIETGLDLATVGVLGTVAIVNIVAMIACFILVGCWIYRASANAHTLSDEMTISPGWAVGWYFVPFANLVKPYQAMREIWMASHFRGNWHGEPTPGLLIGWWTLWIVTNILANLSLRFGMMDEQGQMLGLTTTLDVAASLLSIPLCVILISIIRQVARVQAYAPLDETFS